MEYHFNFTITHKDWIDCYNAIRNSNSGLSDWSRGFVFCLGLMWFIGFFFGIWDPEYKWLSLIWLVLGVTIIWKTAIKPYLEIKYIKEANDAEQPISLDFTDRQISISVLDDGGLNRDWDSVERFQWFGTGVCIWFEDKTMNWIPNRVFETNKYKDQFVAEVQHKLAEVIGCSIDGHEA